MLPFLMTETCCFGKHNGDQASEQKTNQKTPDFWGVPHQLQLLCPCAWRFTPTPPVDRRRSQQREGAALVLGKHFDVYSYFLHGHIFKIELCHLYSSFNVYSKVLFVSCIELYFVFSPILFHNANSNESKSCLNVPQRASYNVTNCFTTNPYIFLITLYCTYMRSSKVNLM